MNGSIECSTEVWKFRLVAQSQAYQFQQEERRCGLFCQIDDPLLQILDLFWIPVRQIGLFRGIFREIEKLDARRQKSRPNQFPFPFTYSGAIWLNVLHHLVAWTGLPSLIAGQTSTPSNGLFLPSCAPARPAKVGYISTMCIISLIAPGFIRPGQFASATTLVPPS